jgi:chorismate mutase
MNLMDIPATRDRIDGYEAVIRGLDIVIAADEKLVALIERRITIAKSDRSKLRQTVRLLFEKIDNAGRNPDRPLADLERETQIAAMPEF